jgi:hypothetical protein
MEITLHGKSEIINNAPLSPNVIGDFFYLKTIL